VVLVVVAAGLFYNYKNSVLRVSDTSSTNNKTAGITIEDKKIADNTKPFSIDITYPYIAGQDEFNAKVKSVVDTALSDFKTNSLDNDKAVKENDPVDYAKFPREYDLLISYTPGQVDENVASVMLNTEGFTGGAHGYHIATPINFDLKKKIEIKLSDIFAGQKDYLQKISDYCIKDLTKQISEKAGGDAVDASWIKQGAGPDEQNFSAFLINKNNIIIYFQEYQVVAYAFGSYQVTVPKQF
jgi:hypothetical protein